MYSYRFEAEFPTETPSPLCIAIVLRQNFRLRRSFCIPALPPFMATILCLNFRVRWSLHIHSRMISVLRQNSSLKTVSLYIIISTRDSLSVFLHCLPVWYLFVSEFPQAQSYDYHFVSRFPQLYGYHFVSRFPYDMVCPYSQSHGYHFVSEIPLKTTSCITTSRFPPEAVSFYISTAPILCQNPLSNRCVSVAIQSLCFFAFFLRREED